MILRRAVLGLISPIAILAQQPGSQPTPNPTAATTGPQSPQWKALSVQEKLKYDARHFVEADNIVFAGMGAALDQGRDKPGAWGEGWGAFGDRYASHLGYYAIQRSIMFPVQAIDHEDTRYFPSTRTSLKGRVADAFLHTIWRHDDSGGMMPAYSEFFGDYGAAALSRYLWWPKSYHNGTAVFIAGSDTILIDAGINLFHEFTPDIKRALHLGR
jgi:hypothetical protein